MLKSFQQFVFESFGDDKARFIKRLTGQLIEKIRSTRSSDSLDYQTMSGMEFREPFEFDLRLHLRRDENPNLEQDSHFDDLSWERLNFNEKGFAIDANTRIDRADLLIPEIDIHIILDPRKEPHSYRELSLRLLDILVHETNHLDQASRERSPFNVQVSDQDERDGAKKSSRYFLLLDEIESMVEGMQARAKAKEIPIDYVFSDYLAPFVQSKYITSQEYDEVMTAWVKHALQTYPDAEFSPKVQKIVDSI
jgi:hypothetical protein